MKHNNNILIKNCKLIDGTGKAPIENVMVLIENGIIMDIGWDKLANEIIPNDLEVLDLNGRTLLPGIINTHVHIKFGHCDYLKQWLYAGVTTIRDMGILDDTTVEEALETRNSRFNSQAYPRVLMCGKFFTAPGGYGGSSPIQVSSEDEVGDKIDYLLQQGCDFIKTVLEDGFDPSTIGLPKLSPELLNKICEEAHKRGAWVSAHVSQVHNLNILVEAGIDEAAHNVYDPIPEELITKMVSKKVTMIPTMNLYQSFCDKYGSPFHDTVVDNVKRFIEAGGSIRYQ